MSEFVTFKNMMLKAKKGQRIRYHRGELAIDRTYNEDLDLIARFCFILYELDTARLYQVRYGLVTDYFVCLTHRLHVRKDEQGSFQEAERIMQC